MYGITLVPRETSKRDLCSTSDFLQDITVNEDISRIIKSLKILLEIEKETVIIIICEALTINKILYCWYFVLNVMNSGDDNN